VDRRHFLLTSLAGALAAPLAPEGWYWPTRRASVSSHYGGMTQTDS
jgi:hypothetical protein